MSDQLKLDVEVKNPITPKLAQQLGDWDCLYPFFQGAEWVKIKNSLRPDIDSISPITDKWFRAFTECTYSNLKVVFLGLCPYHTIDSYTKQLVADGLCFSTDTINSVPPSLFKFYKGMEADLWHSLNLEMDRTNKLDFLAHQGILMANAALTTNIGDAKSHIETWKPFTNFMLNEIATTRPDTIFVGFGQIANAALQIVKHNSNCVVIEVEHPAASAYESRDWKHERVFSQINELLRAKNITEILWDKYLLELDVPF